MVNNFRTTEYIELILVPIDQKLAELTDRIRNSEKPLYPYQKLIAIELSNLGQF